MALAFLSEVTLLQLLQRYYYSATVYHMPSGRLRGRPVGAPSRVRSRHKGAAATLPFRDQPAACPVDTFSGQKLCDQLLFGVPPGGGLVFVGAHKGACATGSSPHFW